MLIGYARVSTADQNLDRQIDALLPAGVDGTTSPRPGERREGVPPKLDLVLQLLCEGDMLKATRLGRLSRFVLHLVTSGADLRERGIGLHVIERASTPPRWRGRAMFGMLSVLAELRRELIVAKTNDGLASACARGRVDGRRPSAGGRSSPRTRPRSPNGSTTSGGPRPCPV